MSFAPAEFIHEQIRLLGASVAGAETYIVAPELNLGFDVGRCPDSVLNVDHIFLSHGHMDHAAGVAYYFSQRMFIDNAPGTMYMHPALIDSFEALLRLWGEIDGSKPESRLVAVEPGRDVELRRDLLVRPFEVNHPSRKPDRTIVPALGFSAIEVRKRLREEYQGLAGPALVELKKKGIAIEQRLEVPLVTYCGDTAPGPFFDLPCVREAKVLLLECTFIDPDHKHRARGGRHMHVEYLREIMPQLNCEKIVLIHLSRRTALQDAREAVRRAVGDADMPRISFLAEHRRRKKRPPEPEPT
ncbi:MAG: MBL fold metallo-hydrolase [Phycisphaerae bacterium]|nr:MBL fold metallo-hydrolase [Phycisphaerae bacterium]